MARHTKRTKRRDFSGQSFNGADFSNQDLRYADFSQTSFAGCDFSNSELEHSSFAGASLTGVDFSNTSLDESDFIGASLSGCDFSNAALESADFSNARVSGCVFDNADTDGCIGLEGSASAGRASTAIGRHLVQQSGHVVNVNTMGSSGRQGRSGAITTSLGAVFGNAFAAIGQTNNWMDVTVGGSIIDLGWLRFETSGDIPGESPSISSTGSHHGNIDARIADFGFSEWLLRAESIGGGNVRLSARNSESEATGEFWEIILQRGESVEVLGGTVYNQLD